MLGETFKSVLIHFAPSDARQTKPACNMLGLRPILALDGRTMPHGIEIVVELGNVRGDMFDVIDDWNIAPIFQKANETANAADIVRGREFVCAVA